MKKIPSELDEHLKQNVTSLACCWLLTLKCGKQLGFTEALCDIVIDNITYLATSGFNRSAINSNSNLSIDNLEIEGMLDSDYINAQDILSGLYDGAQVKIFLINYQSPAMGKIILKTGHLGEIILKNGKFIAELRGLLASLETELGEFYSKNCRAIFGDKNCKINLNDYTSYGTITNVENNYVFTDSKRGEAAGYFNYGVISFLSGLNKNLSYEIQYFEQGKIILLLPATYLINIGDEYKIIAGCDKSFNSCCKKFNNALNFRGEPHLPGLDKMLALNF
jgi:uncharacterized phage protein (TIGR02218 family)